MEKDIEKRLMGTDGEDGGEAGMYGESSMETCTALHKTEPTGICCMTQRTQTGALWQPRGVGWEGR